MKSSPVAAVTAEVDVEVAEAVAALGIRSGKPGARGYKKKEGSFKGLIWIQWRLSWRWWAVLLYL